MVNTTFSFVVFVIGFGFLIFIHELGHFLVAKWVGIRCTQFAIGFGPAIVSWRKGIGFRVGSTEQAYHDRAAGHLKAQGIAPPTGEDQTRIHAAADELGLGETEYRLNYLPLGGYVKMLGQEDLDPSARSANPNAFSNKSVGARFAVISAGVIMNMITGILFFIGAFLAGVDFPPPVVGPIAAGSPAMNAVAVGHGDDPAYRGLRVGDRVLLVDDEEPIDYTDVRVAAALSAKDHPVELLISREGEPAPITYRLTAYDNEGLADLLDFGFDRPLTLEAAILVEDGDAYEAGVRPGMRVATVGGEPVTSYPQMHRILAEAKGLPVPVVFEASDETFATIREKEAAAAKREKREPVSLQQRAEVTMRATPPLVSRKDKPLAVAGFYPPVVIVAVEDGPAADAGVKDRDLLRELGGSVWPRADEVPGLVEQAGKRPIDVAVLREGEPVTIGPVTPHRGKLRVAYAPALDTNFVGGVLEGSPAAALEGFVPGSRVLKVAGESVNSWGDLYRILGSLPIEDGRAAAEIEYLSPMPGDAPVTDTLELSAEEVAALRDAPWVVDTRGAGVVMEWQNVTVQSDTAWGATALGLRKTQSFMGQAYIMLLRLFQGTVPADQLSGPVGITAVGTQVAQQSWSYLFYFLGLLSVNLAVINFLPIPIADGGHAVFLLIEKLKGSPVSAKVQMAAMYVGIFLLGGVFLFVTYHDILKLATGG